MTWWFLIVAASVAAVIWVSIALYWKIRHHMSESQSEKTTTDSSGEGPGAAPPHNGEDRR